MVRVLHDGETVGGLNPHNPAYVCADEGDRSALILNGENITIQNCVIDVRSYGQWGKHRAAIAFTMPEWMERDYERQTVGNVRIHNVVFIDSSPPASRPHGAPDNWCVNFTNGWQTSLRNVQVTGCVNLAGWQLTAGGHGPQLLHKFLIARNTVTHGQANSISVSSRRHECVMRNITIVDNLILDAWEIGVLVGRDQEQQGGEPVITGEHVTVGGNTIRFSGREAERSYPTGVKLKLDACTECAVQGNVIDTSDAFAVQNPRHIVARGLQEKDVCCNRLIGEGGIFTQ